MNKFFFLLAFGLILGSAWAEAVTANFRNIFGSGYKFNTDMDFTMSNTLSAPSSKVLSGTASNLASGSVVCPGTTITVTPSYSSTYATSYLDVLSLFPACPGGGGYCPTMISYSTLSTNQAVNWKSSSVYSDNKAFGQANAYSQDQSRYSALSPFTTEPVAYTQTTPSGAQSNKEGGTAVECMGNIVTKTDGSQSGSVALPSSTATSVTLSTTGSHTISTELSGAECFGAVIKHPLDTANPQFFYLYYFANSQPTIPAGKVSKTITVQSRQNSISCGPTNPSGSIAVPAGGTIPVQVAITNNGQVSNSVTGVSSSDSRVTAAAFNNLNCAQNSGTVPSTDPCCCKNPPTCDQVQTNGFNEVINAGGTKNVCVALTGASTCTQGSTFSTTLGFSYSSTSTACNAAANSPLTCNINNVDIICGSGDKCQITDGTMPIFTGESRTFNLQCAHLTSSYGACSGSSVSWLVIPPNFATITSSDTSQATLKFNIPGTGDLNATVVGDFNTSCSYSGTNNDTIHVQDVARCVIAPPNASVGYKQVNSFGLTCYDSTNAVISCGSSTAWSLVSLSGMFFAQSDTGATVGIDSPVGSTGKLKATIANVSCVSNLTVVQPINGYQIDLKPDSAQLEVNGTQQFTVTCSDTSGTIACSNVAWDPTSIVGSIGTLSNTSDTGALFTATQNGTSMLCVWEKGHTPNSYDCSPITVGQNGTPPTCPVPPCGPGPGPKDCSIVSTGPNIFTAYCGTMGTPCSGGVNWLFNGAPVGTGQTIYIPITIPGTLVAELGGGKSCSAEVGPSIYQCVELA